MKFECHLCMRKISGSFCMSCMWIPTSKLHKYSVCEAISEQMITVLSLNDALVVTTHVKQKLLLCTCDKFSWSTNV